MSDANYQIVSGLVSRIVDNNKERKKNREGIEDEEEVKQSGNK